MAHQIIPHRPAKSTPARKYAPIPCEPGVMIIGKPGETPPPGYVSIPWLVKIRRVG